MSIQVSNLAIPPSQNGPICNTGLSPLNGKISSAGFKIRPDWITLIFPNAYGSLLGGARALEPFLSFYRLYSPLAPGRFHEKSGLHGYEKGIFFRTHDGNELLFSVMYGGNNNTVRLEIPGGGCRRMSERHWWSLCRMQRRGNGYLTRLDLAGDDYSGTLINPRKARRDYARRYADILPSLRTSRVVPKPGVHDTEQGYTAMFGTSNMAVNHCVYEKGKESKGTRLAREYPNWIRWEARFRRRKGKLFCIDAASMRPDNWAAAFFGAAPYVAEAVGYTGDSRWFIQRVADVDYSVADRMVRLLRVVNMQYGKLLRTAVDLVGYDVILPKIIAKNGHLEYQSLTQADLFAALGVRP